MDGRFALFIERSLDDAVSTGTFLEVAGGGTAVEVAAIAIVAFLRSFQDPVAAAGTGSQNRRFQATAAIAAVPIGDISIITLFFVLSDTIAAGRE